MSSTTDEGPPSEAQAQANPPSAPPAYTSPTTSPPLAPPTSTSIPPLSPTNNDYERTIPSLSSVTGDQAIPIRSEMAQVSGQLAPPQWPASTAVPMTMSVPPPQTHKIDVAGAMDVDASSISVKGAASSDGRTEGRAGSVNLNLDDPDVRLAAEALGDLRAGEWPMWE